MPRLGPKLAALLAPAALAACSPAEDGAPAAIHVSAASSLQPVLPELARAFTRESGVEVVASYGATGGIAAQIEAGAPVDLFLAADRASIDGLAAKGLVDRAATYAVGVLVLAGCAEGGAPPASVGALAAPGIARIGLANPELAPYGRAGREALERAGILGAVQAKIVVGENVGIVREHCAIGNVDAAFLPRALAAGAHLPYRIVEPAAHAPIEHRLGIPRSAENPEGGARFAAFLCGAAARGILERGGFAAPPGTP